MGSCLFDLEFLKNIWNNISDLKTHKVEEVRLKLILFITAMLRVF